jgi:hypothetical protein
MDEPKEAIGEKAAWVKNNVFSGRGGRRLGAHLPFFLKRVGQIAIGPIGHVAAMLAPLAAF